MLQERDIGELFHTMRSSYGHLWPYSSEDIPVWLRRLGGFDRDAVMRAADYAPTQYRNHPPNVGQFEELVAGPPRRASTYNEPPKMSHAEMIANRVMLRNLMKVGGVDQAQCQLMVSLKNALTEDQGDGRPSRDWIKDLDQQLADLAADHDPVAKASETLDARRSYCVRQGIREPLE